MNSAIRSNDYRKSHYESHDYLDQLEAQDRDDLIAAFNWRRWPYQPGGITPPRTPSKAERKHRSTGRKVGPRPRLSHERDTALYAETWRDLGLEVRRVLALALARKDRADRLRGEMPHERISEIIRTHARDENGEPLLLSRDTLKKVKGGVKLPAPAVTVLRFGRGRAPGRHIGRTMPRLTMRQRAIAEILSFIRTRTT